MKLRALLEGVDVRDSRGDLDVEITSVTADEIIVDTGASER